MKVIYQTVESLNLLGRESAVFHEIRNYRLRWFKYSSRVRFVNNISSSDHIFIPEVMVRSLPEKIFQLEYFILVQNGYEIMEGVEREKDYAVVSERYSRARHIFSVSSDTTRCLINLFPCCRNKISEFLPQIDTCRFNASGRLGRKNDLITIMPRKNPYICKKIISFLERRLPNNWKVNIIDGLSEGELIEVLSDSKIFINVAGLEGLSLPPIEATLLGNYVVGSSGNGGEAYWKNFIFPPRSIYDINGICSDVLKIIRNYSVDEIESVRQKTLSYIENHPTLPEVLAGIPEPSATRSISRDYAVRRSRSFLQYSISTLFRIFQRKLKLLNFFREF